MKIGKRSGPDYPVEVVRSPAGERNATMRFPYDELELESRLKDIEIALLKSSHLASENEPITRFLS